MEARECEGMQVTKWWLDLILFCFILFFSLCEICVIIFFTSILSTNLDVDELFNGSIYAF